MNKLFLFTTVLILSFASATAENKILYKTDFKTSFDRNAVKGSVKYEYRYDDKINSGTLVFLRNDSLNKSASSYFEGHLSGDAGLSGLMKFSMLLKIGGVQPNAKRQVSSTNIIRLQNGDGKRYLDLVFSTSRYNNKRIISFSDGEKERKVPVNFPVDKYLTINIFLDAPKGLWRGLITEGDLKIFDTDWIKAESIFAAETFKFICRTGNRNDGLNCTIADIEIRNLNKQEWKQAIAKLNKENCSTLPRGYAKVNPKQYNSSFVSWCGDNLADRMALGTPESAEARASELSQLGISGVLYNGRHFRSSYVEEFADIRKYAKASADACRKYGIEMVEHHEPTIIAYRAYPFMLSKLDWTQRDLRTGETSFWFCPLNDNFLNYFLNYISLYQRDTKIAIYMIDELRFNNSHFCACDSCRRKFKEETGLDAPRVLKPKSPSSLEVKFKEWSRKKFIEVKQKLLAAIQKYSADSSIMLYCSDYTDPHSDLVDLTNSAALVSSFVGWENMIYNPLNSYRSLCRAYKNRSSYGDFYNIPVWSLNRECVEPAAHYLSWAVCQGTRHSIWYGGKLKLETPSERKFFKKFNAWEKKMPHQYARYLTDVGVLFSQQSKGATKNRNFFWTDFCGIMDMLIVNNRQYEVILDGNLFYPGYLKKYKTLILASQACLSDTQCGNLEKWVEAGGTAIITGKTSLYDENAARRPDFKLGKAMNLEYNAYKTGKFTIKSGLFGNGAVMPAIEDVSLLVPDKSTVLATAVKGKESRPFIVSTKFGKGRFIYAAGKLGGLVYELEARNRRVYKTVDRPEIENIIVKLYDLANAGKSPLQISAERNVVGIADQLMDGRGKGDIYVHLYNFTGKNIKPGDKAKYGVPEKIEFPKLKSDIIIKVNIPCESQALFQSPDMPHDYPIKGLEKDGTTEFTVPAKTLESYGQVKIKSQPPANMAIISPPIKVNSPEIASINASEPDISALYYPEKSTVKFSESGNSPGMPLTLDNITIIARDTWELTKTEGGGKVQEENLVPDKELFFDGGRIACGKVFKQNMPWAREIYQDKNGAEITVASILPSGDNQAASCSYVLYIPVDTIKGANVEYFMGMHRSGKACRKYTFTGREPEGKFFIGGMRHGQFTGGKIDFMMDFCPDGIWGIFNEDQTTTYKAHVERRGSYYAFRVANNRARYGRKITDKVIILKGQHDLRKRHPMRRIHYQSNRPADYRIQFGRGKALTGFKVGKNLSGYDLDFTMRQLQKYSPEKGCGWIDCGNAQVFTPKNIKGSSIYDQGITGSGTVKYRLDHNNGLGIFNVILSGANGNIAGTVSVNDRKYHYNIAKDDIKTIAVPVLIKNKKIEFSINGKFLLCGLVFQPLANDTEDFIFTRSYWKTGIAPWKVLNPENFMKDWSPWKDLPFQRAEFPFNKNNN